jgi:hypothetical protein
VRTGINSGHFVERIFFLILKEENEIIDTAREIDKPNLEKV